MPNSILAALSGNQDASTAKIRLALNSPITVDKIVMIVEGNDDLRFYSRMYDATKVEIVPVFNCDKIINILANLNPGYERRLIGIKDADFDVLNGVAYSYNNLFLTDNHDLEIMELSSNGVVSKVWNEYVRGISMPNNLVMAIYQELLPLSLLKWYNGINHLSITFDRVKIGSSCDNNGCFEFVRHRDLLFRCGENIGKEPSLSIYNRWYDGLSPDLKDVTNGHDAVDLLYQKIRIAYRINLKKKTFTNFIIDNYPKRDFVVTCLATKINAWALANGYNL